MDNLCNTEHKADNVWALCGSILEEFIEAVRSLRRPQHQSSQLCSWKEQLFERGASSFERTWSRQPATERAKGRKAAQLEAKLTEKNEVIFELTKAMSAKKCNGEL